MCVPPFEILEFNGHNACMFDTRRRVFSACRVSPSVWHGYAISRRVGVSLLSVDLELDLGGWERNKGVIIRMCTDSLNA